MAIVTVTILEGRSGETKDRLVQGITEVMMREIDADPSHVRVLINEIKGENYAVGGKRLVGVKAPNPRGGD